MEQQISISESEWRVMKIVWNDPQIGRAHV